MTNLSSSGIGKRRARCSGRGKTAKSTVLSGPWKPALRIPAHEDCLAHDQPCMANKRCGRIKAGISISKSGIFFRTDMTGTLRTTGFRSCAGGLPGHPPPDVPGFHLCASGG